MSGNVARSSSWIITCESWLEQDAFIVLPVNPDQLTFDLGVRTSNELTRAAQIMYVWRYFGTSSTLVKPIIRLTVNSGNIIPSFDPSIILECAELSAEKASALQAKQTPEHREFLARNYDAALSDYMARIPGPEQVKDYVKDGLYSQVGLHMTPNMCLDGVDQSTNTPDIYSSAHRSVPIGVQNLYAMYSLLDERRIRSVMNLGDDVTNPTGGQTGNRIMLVLNTIVFPKLVVYGWFGESGISYTENAEEPGSFDMSFEIVVDSTVPTLGFGGWRDLASTYIENIGSTSTSLDNARAMKSKQ